MEIKILLNFDGKYSKKNFSWNWFIWFHKFFGPGFFKFSGRAIVKTWVQFFFSNQTLPYDPLVICQQGGRFPKLCLKKAHMWQHVFKSLSQNPLIGLVFSLNFLCFVVVVIGVLVGSAGYYFLNLPLWKQKKSSFKSRRAVKKHSFGWNLCLLNNLFTY